MNLLEETWHVTAESSFPGEPPDVWGIHTEPDGRGRRIVETDCGHYPPRMAEAHLIAAAPELYRTVERLLRVLDDFYPEVPHAEKFDAMAALRKARGE